MWRKEGTPVRSSAPSVCASTNQCGLWMNTELLPQTAKCVDDMAFIHSMHLRANNHAPASMELMCGVDRPGLPSAGAWVTYGLGADNQNLPAFVVLHESYHKMNRDLHTWAALAKINRREGVAK